MSENQFKDGNENIPPSTSELCPSATTSSAPLPKLRKRIFKYKPHERFPGDFTLADVVEMSQKKTSAQPLINLNVLTKKYRMPAGNRKWCNKYNKHMEMLEKNLYQEKECQKLMKYKEKIFLREQRLVEKILKKVFPEDEEEAEEPKLDAQAQKSAK